MEFKLLSGVSELLKAKTEFSKLHYWCECNKLTINFAKTFFVLFSSKKRRLPDNIDELVFNDFVIKRISSIKYIGKACYLLNL